MGLSSHITVRQVAGIGTGANLSSIGGVGGTNVYWFGMGSAGQINSAETDAHRKIHSPGTWSHIRVGVHDNDRGASTFRSRVNAGNGTQVISVTASTTGDFEDTTHSDTIADGDNINYQAEIGAGGTFFSIISLRCFYKPTTDADTMIWTNSSGGNTANVNGMARYSVLFGFLGGDGAPNLTEAQNQYKAPTAGFIRNMIVNVRTNTKTGSTTIRTRVDGVNGNSSVSVGAGVTGIIEDTPHVDVFQPGSFVNYVVEHFADANNFRFNNIATEVGSFNSRFAWPYLTMSSEIAQLAYSANTTYYAGPTSSQGSSAAEADQQTVPGLAYVIRKLRAYVSTNTVTATSTIRVRRATADGNGNLSIPSGATGWFQDDYNYDVFSETDKFNYKIVVGATGTALAVAAITTLCENKPLAPHSVYARLG